MIRDYYHLTKPGIVYGNAITTAAGFLLASRGVVDLILLISSVVGVACIVAAACVFNNYIDRDIDILMARTRDRALVTGAISASQAIGFGLVLLFFGIATLWLFTNLLVLVLTLFGLFVYVALYSVWSKRQTTYATLVGSLAGAIPPTVGYLTAAQLFDSGAAIVFLMFCLWQMPHFYAISLYRLDDYLKAGVPVLPARLGFHRTKVHMLVFIILFLFASSLLTLYGYAGYLYLLIVWMLSVVWIVLSVRGFFVHDHVVWGKQLFVYSLVVNMGLSVTLAMNSLLPF